MFLCNTRLSILGMGDVPTFMINGNTRAFVMGEGIRGASAFVIKGDAPLTTRISYDFIIGDVHYEHVPPFC
jgi:hypothetical protein